MTTATEVKTRKILVAQEVEIPAGPVDQFEYTTALVSGDRTVYRRWSEMADSHLINKYKQLVARRDSEQFIALQHIEARGLEVPA